MANCEHTNDGFCMHRRGDGCKKPNNRICPFNPVGLFSSESDPILNPHKHSEDNDESPKISNAEKIVHPHRKGEKRNDTRIGDGVVWGRHVDKKVHKHTGTADGYPVDHERT